MLFIQVDFLGHVNEGGLQSVPPSAIRISMMPSSLCLPTTGGGVTVTAAKAY
jgi:hypothetical protein